MKGVVVTCLKELVKEKFGKEKWEETLEKAGLDKHQLILSTDDIEDATVLKVIDTLCKVLNISFHQAADAFGDYWINCFTQKLYAPFYRESKSAREFLLKLNKFHQITTESIPNARPPKFEYELKGEKTMIMEYKSHRGLIDIMVSMIKGVGKHYNEDLIVTKLDDTRVSITFP